MGEAKRRKEKGFEGEKRKPPKGMRGRKALRETAKGFGFELGKITTIEGQQYFKDPVTRLVHKVGPKLREKLARRKKIEEERLEQEFLERQAKREAEIVEE